MLFRSLTNTELERWVRNSPRDLKAKAELLRRTASLLDGTDLEKQEMECEITRLTEENDELRKQMEYMFE